VRLALALVVSLLAGVVLAGLAFPLIGGIALLGKSATDTFNNLPEKPPTVALSQRSRILDKNGKVLATLFTENRVPIRLAQARWPHSRHSSRSRTTGSTSTGASTSRAWPGRWPATPAPAASSRAGPR
jgi:hypothetical protein